MEPGGIISLERTDFDSSLFTGRFRWLVAEPDDIRYMITAVDGSEAGNTASSRLRTFSIISDVLIDGFESSNRRWLQDGWQRSDRRSAEGSWSLYDRSDDDRWLLPREVIAELDECWDFESFDRARMVFWETHCFDSRAGEFGVLEIRVVDSDDWQEVLRFTGWQDEWHQRIIDLSEYCLGRAAPIRVRFRSVSPADAEYTEGWRIDEIMLYTGNWVGVEDSDVILPTRLVLFSPFPNPTNSRLSFGYRLPSEGIVELVDITGRTALFRHLSPGAGTSSLDLATLPTGVYLLKLSSRGVQENRRVVLLK